MMKVEITADATECLDALIETERVRNYASKISDLCIYLESFIEKTMKQEGPSIPSYFRIESMLKDQPTSVCRFLKMYSPHEKVRAYYNAVANIKPEDCETITKLYGTHMIRAMVDTYMETRTIFKWIEFTQWLPDIMKSQNMEPLPLDNETNQLIADYASKHYKC